MEGRERAMGKRIDRLALWLFGSAAAYLYFLRALGGIGPAAAVTLLFLCCVRKVERTLRERWTARQAKRERAEELLAGWGAEGGGLAECAGAVCRAYGLTPPDENGLARWGERRVRFQMARRHPKGPAFDVNDALAMRDACRDCDLVVLLVTGRVDPGAEAPLRALKAPEVRALGADTLRALLAQTMEDVVPVPKKRRRIDWRALARRVNPWRAALYGAFLLAGYALTRSAVYLGFALLLAALFCARLRANAPRRSPLD